RGTCPCLKCGHRRSTMSGVRESPIPFCESDLSLAVEAFHKSPGLAPGTEVATDPIPAPPGYLLWCGTCGRSEGRTATEVLGYTRDGWPKCCNQVMAYFTASARPNATDTSLDKPALGSGDTAPDKPALPPDAASGAGTQDV